jgi:hypothetical protein
MSMIRHAFSLSFHLEQPQRPCSATHALGNLEANVDTKRALSASDMDITIPVHGLERQ